MLVIHLGRAPRTKETLPNFLKWRRVTRHPLLFRGLTGSQRTPVLGRHSLVSELRYTNTYGARVWVSITTRLFDVEYRYMETYRLRILA